MQTDCEISPVDEEKVSYAMVERICQRAKS